MKAIIYDCEIKNAIPDKNEQLRPNINYCKGWKDFLGMGISVISVYDYHVGQYRIFCEDNLSDFAALIDDSDHVIGFNQIHFDNQLIAAHVIDFDPRKNWDLYVEAKEASGADKYAKGYKLDDFVSVGQNPHISSRIARMLGWAERIERRRLVPDLGQPPINMGGFWN